MEEANIIYSKTHVPFNDNIRLTPSNQLQKNANLKYNYPEMTNNGEITLPPLSNTPQFRRNSISKGGMYSINQQETRRGETTPKFSSQVNTQDQLDDLFSAPSRRVSYSDSPQASERPKNQATCTSRPSSSATLGDQQIETNSPRNLFRDKVNNFQSDQVTDGCTNNRELVHVRNNGKRLSDGNQVGMDDRTLASLYLEVAKGGGEMEFIDRRIFQETMSGINYFKSRNEEALAKNRLLLQLVDREKLRSDEYEEKFLSMTNEIKTLKQSIEHLTQENRILSEQRMHDWKNKTSDFETLTLANAALSKENSRLRESLRNLEVILSAQSEETAQMHAVDEQLPKKKKVPTATLR